MSEGINLPHLHQLLQQLQAVREKLAGGPRKIRQRENRIAQMEQLLATRAEELKRTKAASDGKSLELKSKDAGLHDLQRKLNVASSNREFEAAQHQIEADKAARAVLEDEILEFLERVEVIQAEITKGKEAVEQLKVDLGNFRVEFDGQIAVLEQQEKELAAQVATAESPLSGTDRDKYRRLVEAHQADALTDATNGHCGHCFVTLTSQQKVQLNSGKPLFCGCGRLLYVVRG
ncbi:MAG: hypothetical protein KDA58_10035 [Planctomycetaceae bacterium]|nr:hypothetical protein [Planctomycetaceae bacterium]